jgi:hypothetical protein
VKTNFVLPRYFIPKNGGSCILQLWPGGKNPVNIYAYKETTGVPGWIPSSMPVSVGLELVEQGYLELTLRQTLCVQRDLCVSNGLK